MAEEHQNGSSGLWKKLSSNSKSRSYRDGKPREDQLLYREREGISRKRERRRHNQEDSSSRHHHSSSQVNPSGSTSAQKPSSSSSRSIRNSKEMSTHRSDRHNHHERRRSEFKSERNGDFTRHTSGSKRNRRESESITDDLNDGKKSKRHKCKHHRQLEEETTKDGRRSEKDIAAESSAKEKVKKGRHSQSLLEPQEPPLSESQPERLQAHHHHCHHHHHHGHQHKHKHHKKCKHRQENEKKSPKRRGSIPAAVESHADHLSPSRMQKPSERLKTNPHSEIVPLDSKEIYADGDKIIVNVNFSKISPDKKEDPMAIRDEHADSQHELGHGSSKPGEPPKKDVKLVSKSKTEFDIFWDDNSQEKGEDHNDDSNLNSGHSAKSSPLSEVYGPGSRSPTKMESKEPRFIPRTVLTEAKTVAPVSCSQQVATMPLAATPPETPPNGEESKSIEVSSPDPAMATPTQDESHPDSKDDSYRSLNSTSIKSPASPPPLTNEKSKAPDIYDPEAPLESPEDVTFVKQDSDVVDGSNVRLNKSPVCAPCSPPKERIDQPRPIPSSGQCTSTTIVSTKSSSSSIKPSRSPARNTSLFPSTASSNAVVTNSSNPVNSLQARLPVMASLQSPAPNSLLAQIQQTLSQNHQKNQAIQQQHLMNTVSSINSLLKNASSSASFSSSSHLSKSQVNSVKNKEVDSPHSPVGQPVSSNATSSRLTLASLQSTANPALKSVIDQLLRVAQGNAKVHSQKPVPSTSTSSASSTRNLFKRPMPVSNQVPKTSSYGFKSSNNSGNSSKHHSHSQSSSHSHHKSKPLNAVDKVFKKPIAVGAVTANNGATNGKMADGTNNDDLPSSAVELQVKEKYLKKLNRQERVVEEVKLVLKPYYQRREVTKDEYKEILRKSVPKICHSKTGEINPVKIKQLIDEYIKRVKHDRKKAKKKPNATSNSNLIS